MDSFCRVSGNLLQTLQKLCITTKFPYPETRRNIDFLRGDAYHKRYSSVAYLGLIEYLCEHFFCENSQHLLTKLCSMFSQIYSYKIKRTMKLLKERQRRYEIV